MRGPRAGSASAGGSDSLFTRQVLFFGGKGGVGKTTLASAYAILSAARGDRTLLVSTDPAHSTGDMLAHPLGPEPRAVLDGLWAMEIDPEAETDRYIADVKAHVERTASPRVRREAERQIDIARLSPGAEEAALFDRFTELVRLAGEEYDRVIFDTAPTGHTLRLLSLPELMTVWIEGLMTRRRRVNALGRMWRNIPGTKRGAGPENDPVLKILERRRERFQHAREIITDHRRTAFAFVTIPERLPFLETRRAVEALDRYRIPVGAILVNRISPNGAAATGGARFERERMCLAEIERSFPAHPVVRIALQPVDVHGVEALRELAATLIGVSD